jgi:hypothetical protein
VVDISHEGRLLVLCALLSGGLKRCYKVFEMALDAFEHPVDIMQ